MIMCVCICVVLGIFIKLHVRISGIWIHSWFVCFFFFRLSWIYGVRVINNIVAGHTFLFFSINSVQLFTNFVSRLRVIFLIVFFFAVSFFFFIFFFFFFFFFFGILLLTRQMSYSFVFCQISDNEQCPMEYSDLFTFY